MTKRINYSNKFLAESLGIEESKLNLYRTLEKEVLKTLESTKSIEDIKNEFYRDNPLFLEIPEEKITFIKNPFLRS